MILVMWLLMLIFILLKISVLVVCDWLVMICNVRLMCESLLLEVILVSGCGGWLVLVLMRNLMFFRLLLEFFVIGFSVILK